MKKIITMCLLVVVVIIGILCSYRFGFHASNIKPQESNELVEEKTHYEPEDGNGVCYPYYKDENGKWCVNGEQYNDRIVLEYKTKLESMVSTSYVVLTNNPNITFEEVHSSICNDVSTNLEETCIVEIRGEKEIID